MARTSKSMPGELVNLHPDRFAEPFWLAAREHRLVAPRCLHCGRFRMPPTPFCPGCRSQAVEWIELSGRATVFTFTIAHQALIPALRQHTPYVIALVEPVDTSGIRLATNLVETDTDEVCIGMPVEVTWDEVHENATVPRFRPVKT